VKLPPRQQRFVEEYLLDLNATQAAIRAGYSAKTANPQAARLLAKVSIQAALAEAMATRADRTGITQDRVLHEIDLLQHSDITHYAIDATGNVSLTAEAPRDAMRAVASLKKRILHTDTSTVYETEIKLWNKPASLRMGGQHLGLFKEQVDISGTVKVIRLPQKAASAEVWSQEHPLHAGRRTDLGSTTEAN
jgi:phage terminase small subunit